MQARGMASVLKSYQMIKLQMPWFVEEWGEKEI
jgi:hypothetical protein